MKTKLAVLLCVFLSACGDTGDNNSGGNEGVKIEGFKDFKLGMPKQKLIDMGFECKRAINIPDVHRCEKRYISIFGDSKTRLAPDYTIAGAPITSIDVELFQDEAVIISAYLERIHYQRVLSAIQEKYGKSDSIYLENSNTVYKRESSDNIIVLTTDTDINDKNNYSAGWDFHVSYTNIEQIEKLFTEDYDSAIWGEEAPISRNAKDF